VAQYELDRTPRCTSYLPYWRGVSTCLPRHVRQRTGAMGKGQLGNVAILPDVNQVRCVPKYRYRWRSMHVENSIFILSVYPGGVRRYGVSDGRWCLQGTCIRAVVRGVSPWRWSLCVFLCVPCHPPIARLVSRVGLWKESVSENRWMEHRALLLCPAAALLRSFTCNFKTRPHWQETGDMLPHFEREAGANFHAFWNTDRGRQSDTLIECG
jgi:hypothetical protein